MCVHSASWIVLLIAQLKARNGRTKTQPAPSRNQKHVFEANHSRNRSVLERVSELAVVVSELQDYAECGLDPHCQGSTATCKQKCRVRCVTAKALRPSIFRDAIPKGGAHCLACFINQHITIARLPAAWGFTALWLVAITIWLTMGLRR